LESTTSSSDILSKRIEADLVSAPSGLDRMPWKLCAGRIELKIGNHVQISLFYPAVKHNSSKAEILAGISRYEIMFKPGAQSTTQELRTGTGQYFKHKADSNQTQKEQALHLPEFQTAQTHYIHFISQSYLQFLHSIVIHLLRTTT
jgi:hypothetical protein